MYSNELIANRTDSPRRESIDSVLAKNLVTARMVAGMTQQGLANAADISRATIAQLETGCSDPRISTIVDLASALGISPVLLLIGMLEARALTDLPQEFQLHSVEVPARELLRMERYLQTGMLKDRFRAGQIGAAVAGQSLGLDGRTDADDASPVLIAASIFSAMLPGDGTAVGIRLGTLLKSLTSRPDPSQTTRIGSTP
jgi:DNA-binding XRE family transcriptional regulator